MGIRGATENLLVTSAWKWRKNRSLGSDMFRGLSGEPGLGVKGINTWTWGGSMLRVVIFDGETTGFKEEKGEDKPNAFQENLYVPMEF